MSFVLLMALSFSVAAEQNVESEEGMQKALKKLQLAAGAFKELNTTAVGLIKSDPTPDLLPETLNVLAGKDFIKQTRVTSQLLLCRFNASSGPGNGGQPCHPH